MKFLTRLQLLFLLLFSSLSAESFEVGVDFLYWHTGLNYLNGIGVKTVGNQSIDGEIAVSSFNNEKTLYQQGGFDPGIRLHALFTDTPFCGFDFGIRWTHTFPDASRTLYGNSREELSLLSRLSINTTSPFSRAIYEKVDSRWEMDLHLIDLELSSLCRLGNHFFVSPIVSLRATYIDKDFHLKSSGTLVDGTTFVSNFEQSSHQIINFHGFGPRIGTHMEWEIGFGFALVQDVALALTYEQLEFNRKNHGIRFGSVDPMNDASNIRSESKSSDIWVTRTLADFSLGVSWECTLSRDCILNMQALWEQHLFYSISTSLSTEGLTLSGTFTF